jgi:hypothetical protein
LRLAFANELDARHERGAHGPHSGRQHSQFSFCWLDFSRLIHASPSEIQKFTKSVAVLSTLYDEPLLMNAVTPREHSLRVVASKTKQ